MIAKIKENKKMCLVIAGIVAFILIVGVTALVLTKDDNKTKNNNKNEEKEQDAAAAAKQYLKENYKKINIDGSTSMIPLHQSLENLFGEKETIEHSKTVDAFDKFIAGEVDILIGVDYSDELLKKAEDSGIVLEKLSITREGFVFLINKNNPVKSLTVEQIKDIYSGKITNWKQVGGDNAPIKAFQRNSDSGSQMRMVKFMRDTKLMETKTEYYLGTMGGIIESIGDYDEGKYSIAYNMYTFTEKQYPSEEVILLNVNEVEPNDDTIFNEEYPIVIYNYIYYDKNNEVAAEFAQNLYVYLMSDEGQLLISDSGYVNLNKKYDRNKNVDKPYDPDDFGEQYLSFYNERTREFIHVDDDGNLLVFNNYADYALRGSKYMNNANARAYLTKLHEAGIITERGVLSNSEATISILGYWFDASMDPDDFFNVRYNGKYYWNLLYYIDTDRYFLEPYEKEEIDMYLEYHAEQFTHLPIKDVATGSRVEVKKEDIKNLYIRTGFGEKIEDFKYIQLFK